MAKKAKFARKYGLFLSDASNEEIVSVSKELMNEMSREVKAVNNTSVAILISSMVALILIVALVPDISSSISSSGKSFVFLTRIMAIALLCISSALSCKVIASMSDASSISSIIWRNIRETADDESAFEQTEAVKTISRILMASKQHAKLAALAVAFSTIMLGSGFIYILLASAGYI